MFSVQMIGLHVEWKMLEVIVVGRIKCERRFEDGRLTAYVCLAQGMELPIPRSPEVTSLKKWNFKVEKKYCIDTEQTSNFRQVQKDDSTARTKLLNLQFCFQYSCFSSEISIENIVSVFLNSPPPPKKKCLYPDYDIIFNSLIIIITPCNSCSLYL